ncbi:MAG: hypothetical protein IJ555_03105 [Ruminococcus sp.]|nr:hypothetical protein [Ruminococcus sp.]
MSKKKGIIGVGYRLLAGSSAIVWLASTEAGGREYNAQPRGGVQEVYADSVMAFADNEDDGYDLTLTLLDIIDDVAVDWLGEIKDSKGRAEYADGKEYPAFELYIIEATRDGTGKTTIYYNCQCSGRPTVSGKTKEGAGNNFDYFFPEYAITARPRVSDNLVKYEVDGKERFTVVPEPETAGTSNEEPAETSNAQQPAG